MTGDHFPRATFYPSVSANRRHALNLKASTYRQIFQPRGFDAHALKQESRSNSTIRTNYQWCRCWCDLLVSAMPAREDWETAVTPITSRHFFVACRRTRGPVHFEWTTLAFNIGPPCPLQRWHSQRDNNGIRDADDKLENRRNNCQPGCSRCATSASLEIAMQAS